MPKSELSDELKYLIKIYGEKEVENMMKEWEKEYHENDLDTFLKNKILKQYKYLKELRS